MEISDNTAIIKCTKKDIEQLQQLSIQTFSDTYQHLNEAVNFQRYIEKAFSNTQLQLELQNPESQFYFLKINNKPVAYIKTNIGLAQTEKLDDEYLEIERIYVLKQYQGLGLGRQLFNKSIMLAKALGKKKVWLGVWEKNPQAIAFYERMGFTVFGKHIFQVGAEDQIDFMMEFEIRNFNLT